MTLNVVVFDYEMFRVEKGELDQDLRSTILGLRQTFESRSLRPFVSKIERPGT